MMSDRFGALAARLKLWTKHNLALFSLVFALLVCSASSAFCVRSVAYNPAYPTNFTGTVTVDSTSNSNFMIDDSVTPGAQVTLISYGTAIISVAWDVAAYNSGMIMQGQLRGYISAAAPVVSGYTNKSIYVDIENVIVDTALRQTSVEKAVLTGGRGYFREYISLINQRPQVGVMVTYQIHATYVSTGSPAGLLQDLLAVNPSVTTSNMQFSGSYMPLTDMLPDLHEICVSLLDPSTGWLPTMNTNLQTLVTNGATANSWLSTVAQRISTTNTSLASTNYKLDSVNSNLQTVQNKQDTQINQLQQIVDYVNATGAADAVENARQDFVDNAGALESGQAALEGAADASLAAVDWNQINIIDTYSQSVNFWMLLVNRLPQALGALWSVMIFALIIAFVLFIVRIRR